MSNQQIDRLTRIEIEIPSVNKLTDNYRVFGIGQLRKTSLNPVKRYGGIPYWVHCALVDHSDSELKLSLFVDESIKGSCLYAWVLELWSNDGLILLDLSKGSFSKRKLKLNAQFQAVANHFRQISDRAAA